MEIKYYGHSCFEIVSNSNRILFDPFISPNDLAKNINVDEVECNYMLISHGHQDHVADAESIAKRCNPTIVSNFEIVSWFQDIGFEKVQPMNHGGNWKFDFGRVKYVNAVHSSVLPDGTYGGNPGGFIIEVGGKRIYYAGDTALHMDMKLIGEFDRPDIAILPIGDNFTMGIDDAIRASDFIQCDHVIGMHYDTFPYIKLKHEEAIAKFKAAGKNLTLMEIGSSIKY